MKGILGRKVGMTQVLTARGTVVPVTVIEAGPCYVTLIKTLENGRLHGGSARLSGDQAAPPDEGRGGSSAPPQRESADVARFRARSA